jgi:cytochrome c-type biogenesis protein CcmF
VVHCGLALVAAGITASSTLGQQAEATLKTGQSTVFGGYRLTYQGLSTDQQAQRVVLTAAVRVAGAGTLNPRMNLYPAASEPIGSPSIRRGVVWDLYASVISLQDDGNSATFRFYRNPGVNWLWLGGFVMALGGAAAAWPMRRRRAGLEPPSSPAPARTTEKVGAV